MKDRTPRYDTVAADRYRALFDNSADAILIMEKDRFVDCNQAAVDMLRCKDKNALLQIHPSEISPEYQPDGQRSFDKANKILANVVNCRSQRFEWVHVKSDGELLPVEVLMTAIPDDEGYTLHIVWRDLSERKRLEKELRHSQKMEALGNLAGGIAHDFNNTLVPIVTYSDLLSMALQDRPELHEWACEISRAGTLATSLVNKLLTVSRKDERLPVTLDLEEAIASALGMICKLIGEDIEVSFQGTGSALWVETDPGDVEQVLLNLASNARDALPTGGKISLTLSKVQHLERPFARLEFTDNGVGMDAETLEQLFVPFFTTKELGSGTGLGMSSVYELVAKAEGQINAQSSVGKGTAIEVLLPIADNDESEPVEVTREETTPFAEAKAIDGAQILVVENDAQIKRLICNLLDQEGFSVRTANNGIKALERLETETPDLILADVVMPQMSGPLMIKRMNARGIYIPVIFLSGYTDDRLIAHGFDAKKISLIRKPFTAAMLVSRVKETLASARKGNSMGQDDEPTAAAEP